MLNTLLQVGYHHGEASNSMMHTLSSSSAFMMMIGIALVGFLVQMRLKSVFAKYSKVAAPGGMTGAEAAAKMLRDNGITNVKIQHVGGSLTDHFDPRSMTINLSDDVYSSRSVSALAVACHECGHAVQHAEGYAPLVMRSALVPVVSFSSRAATWVILAGMLLISSGIGETICWVGIAMIATSAIFSIITLPVEYNASARAVAWLESSHTMEGKQLDQAREALSWAARTYLVAALSAIATLLYYIMILSNRRN